MADPVVDELREEIAARDRAILVAVNERIELVARLKLHKEEHGIDFLDPEREAAILRELATTNSGPLSEEGVRELVLGLLELTKRELGR